MIVLVIAQAFAVGLLLGKVYLFHRKLQKLQGRLEDLESARPVQFRRDPERWLGTFQQDR